MVDETFNKESTPESLVACVSCEETAIEKWVGLTRRIMAIERGYHDDDPTLIRHLYDLNAINRNNLIRQKFFELALAVIIQDANQFKYQHPEYAANHQAEIINSLEILKSKPLWQSRYLEFVESMVYDRVPPLDYKSSIKFLEDISHKVFESTTLAKA